MKIGIESRYRGKVGASFRIIQAGDPVGFYMSVATLKALKQQIDYELMQHELGKRMI